jgi:predicted RNase H-like HicB family nuclease
MSRMNIQMNVRVWLDRESGQYVAHAQPIDVASHGATPDAAKAALDEAVRGFVVAAAKHGTLQEVMEESGYERRGDNWIAPTLVADEERLLSTAV